MACTQHSCTTSNRQLALAVVFACESHKFQTRKSLCLDPLDGRKKHPAYIVHPARVMCIVMDMIDWPVFEQHQRGGDVKPTKDEIMIAALLHDVVEDTSSTYDDIKNQFGATIANLVQECTFVSGDEGLSTSDIKKDNVERAKTMSDAARVIKMADMRDNLSDLLSNPPPGWSAKRVQGYFIWKREVMKYNRGLPGTTRLVECIDALMEDGEFKHSDGNTYRALPRGDDVDYAKLLQEYYAMFL